MTSPGPRALIGSESESQTVRALLEMRELLMRGEFKPGEHIREIPVAERLGVSRTPARLVLERLAHEGLLEARAKCGFMVRKFTLQDILDAIEIRGVLETQQGTGTFVSHQKVKRDDVERRRQLNQLVSDFVARAGAAGFTLEELLEQLHDRCGLDSEKNRR